MSGTPNPPEIDPASFRDPSGFIFQHRGTLYRQVNEVYRPHFERLIGSGLYDRLSEAGRLIPHRDSTQPPLTEAGYIVIEPTRVPFVSYPYEWCFGQLKAAALATLDIQRQAMDCGLSLKDASAYNIQFLDGKPVLIDTLSFEEFDEARPWVAYRQFCQHFLAPLALCAHTDARLTQLLRSQVDGIPLDLASRLLPLRSRLSPSLFAHIHLHARSQRRHAGESIHATTRRMTRSAHFGLIDHLQSCCGGLTWKLPATTWGAYYDDTSYSEEAAKRKAEVVTSMLETAGPRTVWDLGANDGRFSRLAARGGAFTVAFDMDPVAVEKNWDQVIAANETNLLPLLCDLTGPSPGTGWAASERRSLTERGPADLVMALALVHHLAIGNNVPFHMIANFFARLGDWLIIEFVPRDDPQVGRLLASREDVFTDYDEERFRSAFSSCYEIVRTESLPDSSRSLHLMKRVRAA